MALRRPNSCSINCQYQSEFHDQFLTTLAGVRKKEYVAAKMQWLSSLQYPCCCQEQEDRTSEPALQPERPGSRAGEGGPHEDAQASLPSVAA